jgi:hypothetical protein
VRQKKTGQPVRFEMTEQTREAVDSYLEAASKKPGEFLFGGRRGRDRTITTPGRRIGPVTRNGASPEQASLHEPGLNRP